MAEQRCENCGKMNAATESYCFSCGHILPEGLNTVATRNLPQATSELEPQVRWGTAYFGDETLLRLRLRDSGNMLAIRFDNECIFGRSTASEQVDVDLKPYNAQQNGVSRQHIKITRENATIMVQDLGSRNGTFLNGDRLIPYQPRVLRNEDELRLGRLVLRVSFLRTPRERT